MVSLDLRLVPCRVLAVRFLVRQQRDPIKHLVLIGFD